MAKLHTYYVLCPLIDQKSLLGVSQDNDPENVIVTLGRNVVNKYRLSDQKQIGGWTSKDHITCAVVYDNDQGSYVGVFNNNTIKIWKEDSDKLDKVKKYKFPINIFKLIPREKQPALIIFANGNTACVPYAIENRLTYENKPLIKDTDSILDVATYKVNKTDNNICFINRNNKDVYEIIHGPIRDEIGDFERIKINKVKVTRPDDVYVVGRLVVADTLAVFILWSDLKMTMYNLSSRSWKTVGVVPWVSTFPNVSMSWMGKNHLIVFGSNTDQDGAIIVAYNVNLGVGSCRYPMKMYTEDARLYCFNNRIILEASNHIGMLPYILETKRNLSSLLGSHEVLEETTEIAQWNHDKKPIIKVSSELKEFVNLGLPERSICSQVLPSVIETRSFKAIATVLQQFSDIPESIVVQLLSYSIKLINPQKLDFTNEEHHSKLFTFPNSDKVKLTEAEKKHNFMWTVLRISFSDALIIPFMRNSLTLNDALFLMTYIVSLLTNTEHAININDERTLLDWCILLLDTFYQQLVMTKDEKVTKVLKRTLDVVEALGQEILEMDRVMPGLNQLLYGGKMSEDIDDHLSYSIELMEI